MDTSESDGAPQKEWKPHREYNVEELGMETAPGGLFTGEIIIFEAEKPEILSDETRLKRVRQELRKLIG